MILTIINWIYVLTLSYVLGSGLVSLIKKVTGYKIADWGMVIVSGIMLLTVYAQYFSIFAPVGKWANIILCVVTLCVLIICRKTIRSNVAKCVVYIKKVDRKAVFWVFFNSLIVLGFVVLACQKATHPDTDGYHAQTVRWIEDYGAIKGIGNLYHRLAYNSSFLNLQALFSWKFAINQSMHVMNGFLCLCHKISHLSFVCILPRAEIRHSSEWPRCLLAGNCIKNPQWMT